MSSPLFRNLQRPRQSRLLEAERRYEEAERRYELARRMLCYLFRARHDPAVKPGE